ncbi:MAG: AAA family ATPase [Tissierellia bacterium]|nr:AAA family ATPase [Tissierellia bacterium]
MTKTICMFNQKGGVGKTTTVVNLAAVMARNEKKVLVIDMDPQGNTTTGLGFQKDDIEKTIYDLFFDRTNVEDHILHSQNAKGVDLIGANSSLSGLEVELIEFDKRERQLKDIIQNIKKDYDFILIDCPPSLGLLSINALVASDSVLIPIQCEYYALEGVSELLRTYNMVKNSLNRNLTIEGVLLCMFDSRNNLSIEVAEEVKEYFKDKVFATMIPRNIKLAEAPSYGLSVIDYEKNSKGAKAYTRLCMEIIENNKDFIQKEDKEILKDTDKKDKDLSKEVNVEENSNEIKEDTSVNDNIKESSKDVEDDLSKEEKSQDNEPNTSNDDIETNKELEETNSDKESEESSETIEEDLEDTDVKKN